MNILMLDTLDSDHTRGFSCNNLGQMLSCFLMNCLTTKCLHVFKHSMQLMLLKCLWSSYSRNLHLLYMSWGSPLSAKFCKISCCLVRHLDNAILAWGIFVLCCPLERGNTPFHHPIQAKPLQLSHQVQAKDVFLGWSRVWCLCNCSTVH